MRVLITGSATGIGAGLARHLGGRGHTIAVHYRTSEGPAQAVAADVEAAGGTSVIVAGDVTVPSQVEGLVNSAVAQMGGLDVLINNVGGFLIKDLGDVTVEEWDRQIASTVSATFYVTSAALPSLRASGRGRIINFSDSSADKLVARPRTTPYSIGKTGILILTRSLAVAEAGNGITANAILPGVMDNSDPLPESTTIPANRHGHTGDIASTVDFLLSGDAAYVTGAFLHVGGGWNL